MTASALRRLSDFLGVIPDYRSQTGELKHTSDDSRLAIIAAMGIDAGTEAGAAEALRALQSRESERLLEPVCVVEAGNERSRLVRVNVGKGPDGGRWRMVVETAAGEPPSECLTMEGTWEGSTAFDITISRALNLGYYDICVDVSAAGYERTAAQRRVIVPHRCVGPEAMLGDRRAFGIIANLYTLRSDRNWGVGDLTDLATLAEWSASVGAEFVGVNPLHALHNRAGEVSPYSPVSRLFRNPLYLDVEEIAAVYGDPAVAQALRAPELREEIDALRDERAVCYDQVAATKLMVLGALHKTFARAGPVAEPRALESAYDDYVAAGGEALTSFATYMALANDPRNRNGHSGAGGNGVDWRRWHPDFRDPDSPAVAKFRADHPEKVDFHRWLQFHVDRQLETAANHGGAAGLAIGIYQDLAIASAPGGFDTWAYRDLFVKNVSIGAPPDPYAAGGQNWGLPPIDPRALRENGYRFFTNVLRAAFRHAGALRIDHVMGLFRLFWIPDGMAGENGAYVRYPAPDLLGILALESERHRAIVVGEDLGTVPEDVPPALSRWSVLSSKVLFFERDGGGFRAASSYPPLALATANTHDMVPLAGFATARDVHIRANAGALDPLAAETANRERQLDTEALDRRLQDSGFHVPGHERYSSRERRAAVHQFVASTPSVLVGISLDDLAGETEPVNVPGLSGQEYPCWSRKMRLTLTELMHSDEVRALLPDGERATRRDAVPRPSGPRPV